MNAIIPDANLPGSPGPAISIVSPVCNEEASVPVLIERLKAVMAETGKSYEIILVDDGSTDGSWQAMKAAAAENHNVRCLMLSRNFSHQNALLAGLHHARGQAVVSMDSDLQHPPEVIPALLAAWEAGHQVVTTRRFDAKVATGFKRSSSRLFYRFFSFMTGVKVEEGASDFRLIDRAALDTLLRFAGSDKFLRGSIQWMGFSTKTIPYEAGARYAGVSKFNLRKMLKFAGTAITSFSNIPLRLSIWLGITVGMLALGELFYVLLMAFSGETVPGWASTLAIISFLFAALFMVLGIMGVYIARIHTLLQNRPQFIVSDIYQSDRLYRGESAALQGQKLDA